MSVLTERAPSATTGAVVEADRLYQIDLMSLVEGRMLAIRVSEFYAAHLCREMSATLLGNPGLAPYTAAPDILRDTDTFFDTIGDPQRRDRYFHNSVANMHALRIRFAPYLSPIDRLRLELDDVWPGGAGIGILNGRKMFAGLTRVFRGGGAALPHQDILRRDAEGCPGSGELLGQIAVNCYLQPAQEGGELELWDFRATDEEFARYQLGDTYGFDREKIPPPDAVIKPREGDLILFDSTKIHAVRPTTVGERVTVSSFIGYAGLHQRLILWS